MSNTEKARRLDLMAHLKKQTITLEAVIQSPGEERLSMFLAGEGQPSVDEGPMPLGETACDTAVLLIKDLRATIQELEYLVL